MSGHDTPRERIEGAVAFVGLGQIGAPMARQLADWPGGLCVYDLDPDRCAELREVGAEVAESVADLGQRSDLVCVMVRDDDQVRQVVEDMLPTARPGTVVAVHATIAPQTATELAAMGATHGVHVVDAPVSGGPVGAMQGRLAVLVGADDAAVFDRCQPALARLGDLVVHVGPVGAGTAAKLARNLIHFVAFAAVTEGQRLAEACGIDLVTLGQVVRHTDAVTGGPGAIMHRDTTAPLDPDDPWYAILDHVRDLGEKDLGFAVALGRARGVETPLASHARELLGPGLGLPATARPQEEPS